MQHPTWNTIEDALSSEAYHASLDVEEYDKEEWWQLFRTIDPEATPEEFNVYWEGFKEHLERLDPETSGSTGHPDIDR